MDTRSVKFGLILVTILSQNTLLFANEPTLPDPTYRDPFIATVHGAVMAYAGRVRNFKDKYQNYIELPSKHFETGRAKVLYFDQKRKADLVIALPGLATKNFSPMMSRPLDYFSNRGFHTVVINNPWSHTYLIQKPDHWPGDIQAEALAVLDLIPEIIHRIGEQNLGNIHLYGESYGAFLCTVIKASDKSNLIKGKLLLAGPPIHLLHAAQNLDQIIDRSQKQTLNPPSDLGLLTLMWSFLWKNLQGEVPHVNADEMLHVVSIKVFLKHLKRTLFDLKNLGGLFSTAELQNNPRYQDYFKSISANFKIKNSQAFSLSYWLRQLQSKNNDFQVITAQDDFLNWGQNWEIPNANQSITILSWGGHLGFQGFKWWEEVLDKKFGPRLPGAESPSSIGFEAPLWNDPKFSKSKFFIDSKNIF